MMFSRFYILRANNIFLLIRCEEILDLTTNHAQNDARIAVSMQYAKAIDNTPHTSRWLFVAGHRTSYTYIHMDSSYLFGSWLIYGVAVHCACRLDEYVYGLQWNVVVYKWENMFMSSGDCDWEKGESLLYFVFGYEITELIIVGFL